MLAKARATYTAGAAANGGTAGVPSIAEAVAPDLDDFDDFDDYLEDDAPVEDDAPGDDHSCMDAF